MVSGFERVEELESWVAAALDDVPVDNKQVVVEMLIAVDAVVEIVMIEKNIPADYSIRSIQPDLHDGQVGHTRALGWPCDHGAAAFA